MLQNGQWIDRWNPYQKTGESGDFVRQSSQFRHWVTADGSPGETGEGGFAVQSGRYHLYLAKICPWASRTLMARALLGLEEAISASFVEPTLTDKGWHFGDFPGAGPDPLHDYDYVYQLYTHADPAVSGRATIPVLWDKDRDTLVNNESADILRMLNGAFAPLAKHPIDLRPAHLEPEIAELNADLYQRLNNGVYRAGFAQSQQAYESAVADVFAALDALEKRLGENPYLLGDALTEPDIRLFVTLVRFDAAYHGLFKCNLRPVSSYPRLSAYLRRLFLRPGVAQTVDMNHIKAGYYSVKALNPSGIVPQGPELNWRAA